jgi:hypothetical protein
LEGPENGAKEAFSIVKQCMEMPFAPRKVKAFHFFFLRANGKVNPKTLNLFLFS